MDKLEALLADLLAPLPFNPANPTGAPTTAQHDEMCATIYAGYDPTPADGEQARADVAEIRHRSAALELELAEIRKTDPGYPRWTGPMSAPSQPVKRPRARR